MNSFTYRPRLTDAKLFYDPLCFPIPRIRSFSVLNPQYVRFLGQIRLPGNLFSPLNAGASAQNKSTSLFLGRATTPATTYSLLHVIFEIGLLLRVEELKTLQQNGISFMTSVNTSCCIIL